MAPKAKGRPLTTGEQVPYEPPQRTFGHCQACGQLVLERRWLMDEKRFIEEVPPVTPALGLPHQCPQEQTQAMKGAKA